MNAFKKLALAVGLLASASMADIGIGYEKTLGNVQGLGLNWMTGSGLVFQLVVDVESMAGSKTFASLAPRFFYPIATAGDFHPYIGVGINYSTMPGTETNYSLENAEGYQVATPASVAKEPLSLEIPLRFDYQIHPSVSIHTGVGLKFGASGSETDALTHTPTGDGNWGIRGDLVGNAGVTVWFKFSGSADLGKAPAAKPTAKPAAEEEEEE